MVGDNKKSLQVIKDNIDLIDKSITNLEELGVFSYLYNKSSLDCWALPSGEVNKSDYLKGAYQTLSALGQLVEQIQAEETRQLMDREDPLKMT